MRRVLPGVVTAAAAVVVVMSGISTVSAQDLELAATRDPEVTADIQRELDRAGFYVMDTERAVDERRIEEAITDFENHVGWPETGRMSRALLSALQNYNAERGNGF